MNSPSRMNVEFVRAGAGSGKTYYLTNLLADKLSSNTVRPAGVMATTFTVKAASELRERARATLLKKGRLDLSAAIGQARIGTVNSVCGQLIQRFCFELNISPEQNVLGEDEGRRLVASAMESVQTPAQMEKLLDTGARLSLAEADLTTAVAKIMEAARSNNLLPAHVRSMGAQNADLMLQCWPKPTGDHTAALLQALESALPQLVAARAAGNQTGVLAKAIDLCSDAVRQLRLGQLPWSQWHVLASLDPGAKQRPFVEPVRDVARQHGSHNQFHADVREYLALIFDLAADALGAFADAKRELGVVDFTDQEVMLLEALKASPLVRQAISEELDLVLVDEFQDTSPLQLAIFVELAKLAKESIWVGDQKQAIYGFRGTDAELIQQILHSVGRWGGRLGAPLTSSYRSTPALVGLANEVFAPAFQNVSNLSAADVVLSPNRAAIPDQPALLNWSFVVRDGESKFNATAFGPAVAKLLQRGIKVVDKATQQSRPLEPGDIAILCRGNATIGPVVQALARWGIPVAAARAGLLATPEAQIVLACLRRMHDAADTIASAAIVGLTDSLEPEAWLDGRLQFMADILRGPKPRDLGKDWKISGAQAHPLLVRLEALRPRLLSLTPREALRLAKAESGVARLAHQWSANEHAARVRIANVEQLLALAGQYEEECVGARQPASVSGLLLWLAAKAEAEEDDRAASADGAVAVMTCHASKGLEWPVVVLAGLDHPRKPSLWSVRARTQGQFDATAPLANRFIHYWPQPYGRAKPKDILASAEGSAVGRASDSQDLQENTRLLYVTLTRARDMLVLVGSAKKPDAQPACGWPDEIDATPLLWAEPGTRNVGGEALTSERVVWDQESAAAEPPQAAARALRYFDLGAPKAHPRLWFAPSSAEEGNYRVSLAEEVGQRIPVKGKVAWADLGTALHACIACAEADPDTPLSTADVRAILERWRVRDAVEETAVLRQVQAFGAWRRAKWPNARVSAEVPVEVRRDDGTVLRGQIDLLLTCGDHSILIDHKANPSGSDGQEALARAYGGQLDAYAAAVRTAGHPPIAESWLFLPVAGRAVRIVPT